MSAPDGTVMPLRARRDRGGGVRSLGVTPAAFKEGPRTDAATGGPSSARWKPFPCAAGSRTPPGDFLSFIADEGVIAEESYVRAMTQGVFAGDLHLENCLRKVILFALLGFEAWRAS